MPISDLLGTSNTIPTTKSPHNWRLRLVWLQGQLGKDGRDPGATYEEAAAQCRQEYAEAFGEEPPADLLPAAAESAA